MRMVQPLRIGRFLYTEEPILRAQCDRLLCRLSAPERTRIDRSCRARLVLIVAHHAKQRQTNCEGDNMPDGRKRWLHRQDQHEYPTHRS